jgi:HEAT repeat protein
MDKKHLERLMQKVWETDCSSEVEEVWRCLRHGKISKSDISLALHILGEAYFRKAEEDVARFLDSEDPEVRSMALQVLVFHWGAAYYKHECALRLFLGKEDDDFVRATAASCLGVIYKGTKDVRHGYFIAKIVENPEEDDLVRFCAYWALLNIEGIPYSSRPSIVDFRFPEDIDLNLVRRYSQTNIADREDPDPDRDPLESLRVSAPDHVAEVYHAIIIQKDVLKQLQVALEEERDPEKRAFYKGEIHHIEELLKNLKVQRVG